MMKKENCFGMLIVLVMVFLTGCNNSKQESGETFPILSGEYFGLQEPGKKPEIFAPNIISTGMSEINSVFSPDYWEFYYSIRLPNGQLVIMEMLYDGSQWSSPEVASFSGEYSDADPFISYDNSALYYISKRPVDTSKVEKKDWDIWRCHRNADGWSDPERLGSNINSESDETYPCLTRDGKLYFSSGRVGANNKDIYYAEPVGDRFEKAVRLSDTVNSHWEGDIYISPDEDYMIFASFGRETGSGLYITFKKEGQWEVPQRMSEEINVTGREFCPIVSPDGKYFLYTSSVSNNTMRSEEKLTYQMIKDDFIRSYKYPQMGKTDIYWVDIDVIKNYRSK